jgi:anthranilate synthase
VESSPIAGTIRRGANAMEDAERLRALYNSDKDEVELTMCTDVDRNDKARICEPGSVRLLSRRLIERYAGLFHTADHVEGRLREGYGGIDAFLSHMWAVTLTGAPKRMAVRLIEEMEKTPREWYGAAVGAFLFNGDVNTGITIRTVHLRDGIARYRAGASLVFDSDGAEEERETRTKATTFFRVMGAEAPAAARALSADDRSGAGLDILMIDNEDSFVHTLADYFRQTGAEVRTYRAGISADQVAAEAPDLVVHSPGPGRAADFGVPALVRELAGHGIRQFGVCLGLQGIVEAFGGEIDLLDEPRHGKEWQVSHDGDGLFAGLPSPFTAGAYHSLVTVRAALPESLRVTAWNEDGLVMAARHCKLPVEGLQFHPESILSMAGDAGHHLIRNVVAGLVAGRDDAAPGRRQRAARG